MTRIVTLVVTPLAVTVTYTGRTPLLGEVSKALRTAGVQGGLEYRHDRTAPGTLVLARVP